MEFVSQIHFGDIVAIARYRAGCVPAALWGQRETMISPATVVVALIVAYGDRAAVTLEPRRRRRETVK